MITNSYKKMETCVTCIYNINGQCWNSKLNPSMHDFPVDNEFSCEYWVDNTSASIPSFSLQPSSINNLTTLKIDYSNQNDWTMVWPRDIRLLDDRKIIITQDTIS